MMLKQPAEIREIAEKVFEMSVPELRRYISILDFCAGYEHAQNDLRPLIADLVIKESTKKPAIKHKLRCNTHTTGFHHDCTCGVFPLKSHKDQIIAGLSDENTLLKKQLEVMKKREEDLEAYFSKLKGLTDEQRD